MFCISSEQQEWGIGKLLHIDGSSAHIEYFLAPTIEQKTFIVNKSSIKQAILYENKRIYWNDPNSAFWRVGRLTISDEHHVQVQFPNKEVKVLPIEEVFVRCAKPIEDPTLYLAGFVTETPLFAQARTKFMRSMIAQRGLCHGMSALLSSSIALEPHQWQVVTQVLRDPVQRYLLADEVGLGKTVEAGIIIRQYLLDHPNDGSAIVVAPESLVKQWQRELSSKFHLSSYLDSGALQIVSSKEFEQCHTSLFSLGMLVIDEAHHVVLGVRSDIETNVYIAIKKVAHKVNRLLLLSATPALGNEMGFLALLHLLDPSIYSLTDYASFKRKLENRQDLARIVAALTPDNFYFMYEHIDQLLSLFSQDDLLTHHTTNLRTLLETNPNEVNPEIVKAIMVLRSHISETYKLHRRILRNRRASVCGITPQRTGLIVDEHSADHEILLAEKLEAWRTYIANYFYNRYDSNEYKAFAELHWKYIGYFVSNPSALAGSVKKRIENEGDIIEGQKCPLIDGEKQYLSNILVHADSLTITQTKFQSILNVIINMPKDEKVVIFCSDTSVADSLFEFLQKSDVIGSNVLRHSPSEYEWEIFQTSKEYRYLICDYRAEEGLNLQGNGRHVLHYDLPLSPNRIEQRMGRLDRYGFGNVKSITCLCLDNSYCAKWLKCLDEGFNVFRFSIASLQYLIDDKMMELRFKIMSDGYQAIDDLRDELMGDDGLIKCELDRIKQQDELDALSYETNDEFEKLEEYDAQWEKITSDIDEWVEKRMIFGKVPYHIEKPYPPDFVFRYEYLMNNGPRTLMPVDDFFYNCKNAIDFELKHKFKKRMTYPYTFRRETSYMRKLRILRFGDDFVTGIMDVAKRDDSGTSFAMWRCNPDRKAATRMFYRFDLIVEANLFPAKHFLDTSGESGQYATEEAFHRLGDLFLPPMIETVWLKESFEEVEREDTIEILNRDYNKKFDKNINADLWKWLLSSFPDLPYWVNWSDRCVDARQNAEQVLINRDYFKESLATCMKHALEISQRHLSQLRSRCIKLSGHEYNQETMRLQWQEKLYESIMEGIRNPAISVASTGIIFLSKENIRRFF